MAKPKTSPAPLNRIAYLWARAIDDKKWHLFPALDDFAVCGQKSAAQMKWPGGGGGWRGERAPAREIYATDELPPLSQVCRTCLVTWYELHPKKGK